MSAKCTGTNFCNSKFRLVEGTQGQVWQLQVVDNQLLCGHNGGTFAIDGAVAAKISDVTGGWCTVNIPGRSDLLLQSTYTGLVLFRKNAAGRWQFAHRIGGFNEPLKRIAFDEQQGIWGAHPNKGLFYLRLSNDLRQITEFKRYTREDGLPTEFRLDLAPVDKHILINTFPAPLRIEQDKGRWQFKSMNGDFARRKILPGVGREHFAADSSGVRLFDNGRTYYFPLSLVPSFENIVALPGSRYLFCLETGFAVLDKQELNDSTAVPRSLPVIRSVETADGHSFLPNDELTFSWSQNSLRFYFAAPFFERSPKFSWRLEGFANNWSAWQTGSEKEFTNLPPGKYAFHLRTDSGDREAVLSFRIRPPFYLSEWALGFYLLLTISLFWGIEKMNRRRMERQRLGLEADKQTELARQRTEAEREKLMLEVENKSRELSNAALNLIRKNEVLQRLKDDLLDSKNDPRALQKIMRLIDEHLEGDHDWEIFEESFNRVHDDFFKRLMYNFPDLTPGDMRLAAYLKMNLSSKEIAPLLNISVRGVENKRYRLRKKLGLPEEANLTEFIMNF
ncbi:MAG: hypothetical protein IPJ82_13785 [Lewinellaceae bacterium]|nr:hypothetical protein [Lewinellaceae bacterium]